MGTEMQQHEAEAYPEGPERKSEHLETQQVQESLRRSMQKLFAGPGHSSVIPTQVWLQEIAPVAQRRVDEQDALDAVLSHCGKQLENDSGLQSLFTDIIIDHAYERLEQKSGEQEAALRKLYLTQIPVWNLVARRRLTQKLHQFQKWIDAQQVVRSDADIGKYSELKSPRLTGNISSFGIYDVPVQADRYVYASLSDMPHFMAGHVDNQETLKVWGNDKKPELLMQDIANIVSRYPDTWLRAYLTNMFDEKHGKNILALYGAYVFDSPAEASAFFRAYNHPQHAQHWDKEYFMKDVFSPETGEKLLSKERCLQIQKKMRQIADVMGIEPPLSQEVRIPDSVEVIQ